MQLMDESYDVQNTNNNACVDELMAQFERTPHTN